VVDELTRDLGERDGGADGGTGTRPGVGDGGRSGT